MKRVIWSVLLTSVFVLWLSACSKNPPTNTVLDNDTNIMTWTTKADDTVVSCSDAVQWYLDQSDKKWHGSVIKTGDTIEVQYIWRLSKDKVFDTSIESVAKACGKFHPQRNYKEWLTFTVGAWQMIPGFDEWVVGMKVGQTKTLQIPASKWYGERRDDAIIKIKRSDLPEAASNYKVGMEVMTQQGQRFKIIEVADDSITFDANHELAGKDLIFDVTIVAIK